MDVVTEAIQLRLEVGERPEGFDADHEGHPGWQIDQLSGRIDEWMSIEQPMFVLLMIGTNDAFNKSVVVALEQLEILVEKVVEGLPDDGSLLLSTIPPFGGAVSSNNDWVLGYNQGVRGVVEVKFASSGQVVLVDTNASVGESDLYTDGVHLSSVGYGKMAQAWHAVLSPLLLERQAAE